MASAVATQQVASNAPVGRRDAEAKRGLVPGNAPPVEAQSAGELLILRKASCACGGGCPRCEEDGRAAAQTKLKISTPGDRYEQEADRIADEIMRMPATHDAKHSATPTTTTVHASPQLVQRKCSSCESAARRKPPEEEDRRIIQTKKTTGSSSSTSAASHEFHAETVVPQGGGASLSPSARAFFEPRFGHDFSHVRVHTDARADETARAIDARAYTFGQDIAFRSGEYAPDSYEGKRLLAHELAHTLQQSAPGFSRQVQRACAPAALARTQPLFFPQELRLSRVFAGRSTLRPGDSHIAVGLVQQALVDLCFNLGTSGPNGDGVDKSYGGLTEQAVRDFQTTEAVPAATPGVVDQNTLRCLDATRSQRTVQCHQSSVPDPQFQITQQLRGGRIEDIFFARGSSTLDIGDRAKILMLTILHQGCALTLEGYVSEDELVEFGPQLATDRINAVEAEFAARNQHAPGPLCTPPPSPPAPPLRTPLPKPDASAGIGSYRDRRKVEVVPAGVSSTTMSCSGARVIRQRPLDATETPVVNTAITDGVAMMDTALAALVPGNAAGDSALTSFFGGVAQRTQVVDKLRVWRRHLDRVVRRRKQRGTACDAVCTDASAYNNQTGGRAMMTVCDPFFGSGKIYPSLTIAQNRALVLVHEAGHGSLDTEDVAYDTNRLIHFIGRSPSVALTNTDSFVTLIRCLAGLLTGCALPPTSDTLNNMTAAEEESAQEGIAWLDTWLIWAGQDLGGLYEALNRSRLRGRLEGGYYGHDVFTPFAAAFNLRRPTNAPPTMREQTMVASVWDRFREMSAVVSGDLTITKPTGLIRIQRWRAGTGRAPGTSVFLTDAYFVSATTARQRVEMLLSMIIAATPTIDVSLRPAYENFVKDTVRLNWSNHP